MMEKEFSWLCSFFLPLCSALALQGCERESRGTRPCLCPAGFLCSLPSAFGMNCCQPDPQEQGTEHLGHAPRSQSHGTFSRCSHGRIVRWGTVWLSHLEHHLSPVHQQPQQQHSVHSRNVRPVRVFPYEQGKSLCLGQHKATFSSDGPLPKVSATSLGDETLLCAVRVRSPLSPTRQISGHLKHLGFLFFFSSLEASPRQSLINLTSQTPPVARCLHPLHLHFFSPLDAPGGRCVMPGAGEPGFPVLLCTSLLGLAGIWQCLQDLGMA